MFGLKRWSATQLFWSWCAYWVALGLVTIGPGLLAAWRVSRPGGHGKVVAGLGNGTLNLDVASRPGVDAVAWSGTISLTTAALWIAVPPLVLWVLWLARRPRGGPPSPGVAALLDQPAVDPFPAPRRAEPERQSRPEGSS